MPSNRIVLSNTTRQTLPQKKLRQAIELVVKREKHRCESVSAVYCGDKFIKKINRQHLKHDYATDTISFRFNDGADIDGEFYISLDTVRRNARQYAVSLEEELLRVTIHSVLHLIGYNDETDDGQKQMHILEERYLEMLKDAR